MVLPIIFVSTRALFKIGKPQNKRVKKEIEIRVRKFLIRARKLLIVAAISNFILGI